MTVSKVIFEFFDKSQIIYIRFADLDHYSDICHNGNPNNRKWFVGWVESQKTTIIHIGWTDQSPNQTNAVEWIKWLKKL
jgi:hypothetical protein